MTQPDLPWGIYIRTSTFEQGEKSSPLKQFIADAAWAKANGKTIPGIDAAIVAGKVERGAFIFMDHQTGTNDDRPDLQRFMSLAKSGKIGGIVCYVVDRAARNMSDAIRIHRELKRMQVGFKFALQNFDDSASGELMFRIFAAFAEYECQIIKERTHDGLRKRILGEGGKWNGKPRLNGPALYGYGQVNGIPFEHPKEGPIARFFLTRAIKGETAPQIAKAMNAAGYRARKGTAWRDTTLSKLLRKAHCYAGIYRHQHGVEAAKRAYEEAVELMGKDAPALSGIEIFEHVVYPPLITREEANLILAKVERNREERCGQPPAQFVLAHYIWCSECGTRVYARCGRYYCGCLQLGRPRCKAKGVMQHFIEPAVIDGIREYLRRPEGHYALALADYNNSRGSAARDQRDIEKQVKQAAKEQEHYDEQATLITLTPRQREIARKKAHQAELKFAELNAELRQARTLVPLPSKAGIVAAFGQVLAIVDRMKTFDERRAFIEATVGRILTDGRKVEVTGAFDVEAIQNAGSDGGTYPIKRFTTGLDMSAPIPFTFSARIVGGKRPGAGRPRKKVA
jgi:DNA invertase Pin-like site-specific DNA recombinase